ncbi:MAG: hypothetical protein IJX13_04160, partial [Clostridia bacterium]|nr:hypothetical protein [Clostridia bacterium]
EYGDTIKETLTLEMPENWNRIFDMAGLWIETDRYDIKINGVSVNTGKEQLTYLVYGDCTITLTPAYFLDVGVEPDGMYSVILTDPGTTLAEIAEMLGIDGTKYVWEINGNSGISLSEKIGNYVYGYGRYYINLRPVRVGFYVTVTDEFGNTSTYETWGEEAFPLQATAQQMVDWLNGHIWVSFDYHTIIWHNKLTGESIEITSPDFVWEYDPRMEGSIGTCYFAIEITCNLLRVNVEIVDPYSENGGVYDTLELTEAISIVEILEKYGYGTDRQMLIYDDGYYVDLDHVVTHSTHIRIEITAGTEEPDPEEPQEGFEVQYDVTDRDGVNYTGSVWVTETLSIADVLYSIENAPFYFDFGDGYEVLLNYELIDDSFSKGAYFTYVDAACTITVRPTYKLVIEGEFNETFYFATEGPTPLFEIANRLGIDFNNYFWVCGGETVDGDRTVGELFDYDCYSYHYIRVEAKRMSVYVVYYDMYGGTQTFPLSDAEDGISLEAVFERVGLDLSNQRYKISATNVWGEGFEMELSNTLEAYHPGYELEGYEGTSHYTVYVQSLSFEVKVTLFNNTGVNTYNEMILHEQVSVGQVFDWVCDGLAFEELVNFSFYTNNSDMWLDGADSMIWASCEITFQIPDVVIEGGEGEDSGEIDKGYITVDVTLYFENDNTLSNSFDIKGSYSTLENVYYNIIGEGALAFEESMKIGYWTVNGIEVYDGSYAVYDGDVICFYQTVSMEGGDSGEDIPPVEEYPPEVDLPDAPVEGVTLKIRVTQYDINGDGRSMRFTVTSPTAYFIDVCPNLCGESFEFTQEWGYWMLDGKIVTADTVIYDGCHLELYQTKVPDDSGDSSEGESDSVGGGSSSDSGSDSVGGGSSDNGASGDDGWGGADDSFDGTEVIPP